MTWAAAGAASARPAPPSIAPAAATFAALAVIPLMFLAQLAFLVAFGVLLDTTLVRALLAEVSDSDRFIVHLQGHGERDYLSDSAGSWRSFYRRLQAGDISQESIMTLATGMNDSHLKAGQA